MLIYLPHRKLRPEKHTVLQRKNYKFRRLLFHRKIKKTGYFKQEVYLNNKTLYLKGELSRIFFFFLRVIYPYLRQIALHVTATYKKVIKLSLVLQ